MIGIGELSRRSGFAPKTLRYYDEIRLLVPEGRSPGTGIRRYGLETLETLRLIRAGKEAGLRLRDIKQLLSAVRHRSPWNRIRSILDRRRAVLADHLRALKEFRRLLDRHVPQSGSSR